MEDNKQDWIESTLEEAQAFIGQALRESGDLITQNDFKIFLRIAIQKLQSVDRKVSSDLSEEEINEELFQLERSSVD